MNETEIRILSTLGSEIGNPISISELTKRIRINYGSADYKNIHKSIQNFGEKNIIKFEKSGNAMIAKINFANLLIVDIFTEIEIIKKINFLEKHKKFQSIFSELIIHVKEFKQLKTLMLLDGDQNAENNKIELLMIVNDNEIQKETKRIKKILEDLKNKYNIEIINLIIENNNFINYLKSQESNIVKENLKNKIILFKAQTLWIEIKECVVNGFNIKTENEIKLNNISEEEIKYNLSTYGYTEIMNENEFVKQIELECLIISIMLKEKYQKYFNAIPIIVLKNKEKLNYNLLIYLSNKYETHEKLFRMFKIINHVFPTKKIICETKKLTQQKIKITDAEIKKIKEKMIQYNMIKE